MDRIWIGLGALAGLTSVAMAALAAHALPASLSPDAMQMVRSALRMQGWHALALLFTGLWASRGGMLAQLAGLAFTLGLLMFCGAVYALALGGVRLADVAPAGGMLLMLGWALLGLSALRRHA
jgi:uncharacterized membrane protein YgdD (TMEM256/DUF423 family)